MHRGIRLLAGGTALLVLLGSTSACDRVHLRRVDDGSAGGAASGADEAGGADRAGVIAWRGSWRPGLSLSTARSGHAAVALADGRVLVSGGVSAEGPANGTAELLDPDVAEWEATGPMSRTRAQHTATLLPSGEVLVVGGDAYFQDEDSDEYPSARVTDPTAEIFDPATGKWRETASPGSARIDHTATLMSDGRVLVVGGHEQGESSEIYDPVAESWSIPAEGSVAPQGWHGASLLPDGKVIVVGGWGAVDGREAARVYDPRSDSWDRTELTREPRLMHSTTALGDGRVLVAGGADDRTVKYAARSAEIYDHASGLWQAVPDMRASRSMHEATLLDSGRVLITGGAIRKGREMIADVEVYDPTADTWTQQPPMSTERAFHTATLLPNGSVVVVGGTKGAPGQPYVILDTVEIFAGVSEGDR